MRGVFLRCARCGAIGLGMAFVFLNAVAAQPKQITLVVADKDGTLFRIPSKITLFRSASESTSIVHKRLVQQTSNGPGIPPTFDILSSDYEWISGAKLLGTGLRTEYEVTDPNDFSEKISFAPGLYETNEESFLRFRSSPKEYLLEDLKKGWANKDAIRFLGPAYPFAKAIMSGKSTVPPGSFYELTARGALPKEIKKANRFKVKVGIYEQQPSVENNINVMSPEYINHRIGATPLDRKRQFLENLIHQMSDIDLAPDETLKLVYFENEMSYMRMADELFTSYSRRFDFMEFVLVNVAEETVYWERPLKKGVGVTVPRPTRVEKDIWYYADAGFKEKMSAQKTTRSKKAFAKKHLGHIITDASLYKEWESDFFKKRACREIFL